MNKFAQIAIASLLAIPLGPAVVAAAPRIGSVTRLDGQREEKLTGMGLVVGLNGTGDGGDYMPAIRPLAQMLSAFKNGASIAELSDANNVAIVALTVTVPENGGRNGDKLDVHVTSIGAAKSLAGGRLFMTPMTGPTPLGGGVFALSEGAIILEDETYPTVGRVEGGCTLEVDMPKQLIRNGQFDLIISNAHASITMASNIAKVINDSEGFDADGRATEVAVAIDAKNIRVTVPSMERARPDSFLSRIRRLPLPVIDEEARVRINERLGTIIITGDVEISPAIIRKNGLTINTIAGGDTGVTGPADAFAGEPAYRQSNFVPVASAASDGQRAKLRDLVDALDALDVSSEDTIDILKELHATGKLHAKLIVD